MTAPRPPIDVLYCDLDGTLVGPGASLFASADGTTTLAGATAIRDLLEAGVRLVLVSGRTHQQMEESARMLGATGFIAELGGILAWRETPREPWTEERSTGAFTGTDTPFEAMVRTGAGGFLLEHYAGALEPHTPWSSLPRESTMLLRGYAPDAADALAEAGYDWLEFLDNGVIPRSFPGLDVEEVHAYHLVAKGVSKASGVRLHQERTGVDPARTAAIGDSPSDLELATVANRMFIVANGRRGVGDDLSAYPNASFTQAAHGDGVAEAVTELLAG